MSTHLQRATKLARTIATFSSCTRDQVGAVIITTEGELIIGWNGTPAGSLNCDKGGCTRSRSDCPSGSAPLPDESCLHAERNCLIWAGAKSRGATLVVTRAPCNQCTLMITQCKIDKVEVV